jgi:hypothetical protein
MNEWDKLLTAAASGGASDSTTLYFRGSPTILQPEMIAASISTIFINGDVVLQGQHKRLERPLTIAATGNVSFSDGTTISGLVKILAGKQVTIPSGVEFDAPIVYSQTAIELQSNQLRAQFFAPSIIMRANSAARYPSVVVSPQIQTKHPPKNQIMMESGSRLEGSMLFLAPAADTCLATIKDGARIVGSLYSTGYVTLDGSVDGTVITNEFYFYQSPTTYFGWMRSAKINRTVLSKSYLVPPGFSDSPKLDVLDWL